MINYYDEIKEKLLKNEIYAKVKDYSKERNKVLTYFEVGKKYNLRTSYSKKKYLFELIEINHYILYNIVVKDKI